MTMAQQFARLYYHGYYVFSSEYNIGVKDVSDF